MLSVYTCVFIWPANCFYETDVFLDSRRLLPCPGSCLGTCKGSNRSRIWPDLLLPQRLWALLPQPLCLFVRFYVWAVSLYLTCKPSRGSEWMEQKGWVSRGIASKLTSTLSWNQFFPTFSCFAKGRTHPTILSLPRLVGRALRFRHNLLTIWDDRNR